MPTVLLRGLFFLLLVLPCYGRVTDRPSVEETMDNLLDRLVQQLRPYQLRYLSEREVERFLTPSEKSILGTRHISFRVNIPVTVYVLRGPSPRRDPFWLQDRSFERSTIPWRIDKVDLKIWQREFDAGTVGLGINSFLGGGSHYAVVIGPKFREDSLIVTDLYPTNLLTADLKVGAKIYVDRDDTFPNVPVQFAGHTVLQTSFEQRDDAKVRDLFRWTDFPAVERPDQIVLTWSEDPKTTQTIQWRTSERIQSGMVRYGKTAEFDKGNFNVVGGKTERLYTRLIVNDSVVRRHTAVLRDLEPGTTYRYTVGDGSPRNWSAPAEFKTAPAAEEPFSFVYMGDAQNGLYRWGSLLRRSHAAHPDAAFYIVAGDLVNRGHERDDWDTFFYNARGVFDRRTFVPVIGNHDCLGGHPTLYLRYFNLPNNGPPKIEKERVYSFEYGNAIFVVLDSNLEPSAQNAWMEQELAKTKATWKFVTFHHPAYSSAPQRDNKKVRESWPPLMEKLDVDFVLQGHDHAYMRTPPMENGVPAAPGRKAPIYIVSVSGSKMYKQDKLPYSVISFTNTPTYQVFNITGNRLSYRTYDQDGRLRDQISLEKPMIR